MKKLNTVLPKLILKLIITLEVPLYLNNEVLIYIRLKKAFLLHISLDKYSTTSNFQIWRIFIEISPSIGYRIILSHVNRSIVMLPEGCTINEWNTLSSYKSSILNFYYMTICILIRTYILLETYILHTRKFNET